MMPAWYQRMNPRERTLSWIVAGSIILLINIVVWSKIFGMLSHAHADLASRQATRKTQAVYIKERDIWVHRDQWLKQHQPTLKSPGEASTLLDQIKQIAGKHNVLIENPAIGVSDSTPDHQSVFASIETKSPWPPLLHFLYDVQQPDSFVVFENVTLAIDGSDPTMMRGKFKIARWFVPAGK
ncbi:MAG TPA: hypothetical protein VGI42_06495 [Chthoniobacterales bacterium]|jgi:hypothetical protein